MDLVEKKNQTLQNHLEFTKQNPLLFSPLNLQFHEADTFNLSLNSLIDGPLFLQIICFCPLCLIYQLETFTYWISPMIDVFAVVNSTPTFISPRLPVQLYNIIVLLLNIITLMYVNHCSINYREPLLALHFYLIKYDMVQVRYRSVPCPPTFFPILPIVSVQMCH